MTQIGLNGFTLNSSNKKLVIISATLVSLTLILTGQVQELVYIIESC